MKNMIRAVLLPSLSLALAVSGFGGSFDNRSHGPSSGGAVFIMTNDAAVNEVISYERTPDGQLFVGDRYQTGGRGSGGTIDPLQSQGSLTLSEDHSLLFAANAGSGTVSVFRVWGARLKLVDRAASGGSEPLSIAQSGPFVYVLNGAAAGSVAVFRWDDRKLRQIPDGTVFLSSTSAGGSSITVSPDRKTVAVTERLTNNIDTFKIAGDGSLSPIVVKKSNAPGVFAAHFAPNGALIVSETGSAGATNASSISSYSVLATGRLSAISPSVPTLGAANCWNAISPNGKWVYTSNSASNSISGFTIGRGGALTAIGGTVLATNPPNSTNLDLAVSSDSDYLYELNAAGGTVGIFAIQNDGSLVSLGEVEGFAKSAGLNGIAAF